jgi:hypothetical protein
MGDVVVRRNRSGSAVVEVALMMPWLIFIFVGVLDFGFYAYAVICTESAARVAAIGASGSSGTVTVAVACPLAIGELKGLPNIPSTFTSSCTALPVIVTAHLLTCSTTPQAADCTANPIVSPSSAQIAVTYQSLPMIPIPGVLMSRLTLTRVAEMRVSQ